ncbi:MAG: DUF4421 family protein [Bacteroidales bacterium]|nr:DUF4421 family protein [Bacteroidales bacterium]
MKQLHILFVLILFGIPALLPAQSLDSTVLNLAHRADEKLYERQHRVSIDTAYIGIPEERWTFKSQFNVNTNFFGISLLHEGEGAVAQLASVPAVSQGISVSWRNFTVGAAINPAWFIKSMKNDDICYSISMYGNKFGMAATIRSASTLQGLVTALPDSLVSAVPIGSCKDLSADFDAYYAFNGERFSYPAAFSQSQVQKQSAGSPLLSVAVRNSWTTMGRIEHLENEPMSLWMIMLCLGGGYAHNFVTWHHWLLHVSTVGNAAILKYNRLYVNDTGRKLQGTVFDLVGSAQFSALHWTGRFFYGFNATARGSLFGRLDTGMYNNASLEMHFLFGLRI